MEILPLAFAGERVAIQARVSGHPGRRRRNGRLFFEFPAEIHPWSAIQGRADDCHDAFARALVMSAMEAHADLAVHGRVSRSLLDNLARFQAVVAAALPKYRPAEVLADEVIPSPATPRAATGEAILGFSGGLDSVYTLYTHHRGVAAIGSRRVPNCLFVHGFDIPLWNSDFRGAFDRARRITDALSSRLVPLRTNLKGMLPYWPNSFGPALAAVLSLFERRYPEGILASSYEDANPYALEAGTTSTTLTDPLFSSATFTALHDPGNSRPEKSEMLRDFETGRRYLRVCYAGRDLTTNCGTCGKCVLQMLSMKMAGVDDLSAFAKPLAVKNIRRILIGNRAHLWQWRNLIDYAVTHGWQDAELLDAMRQQADACEKRMAASGASGPRRRSRLLRPVRSALRWTRRFIARARRPRDDSWW